MKKDLTSENTHLVYTSLRDFESVNHEFPKNGNNIYTRIQPGLSGIIKTGKLTTGFLQQPLGIFFNRILKRAVDVLFSLIIIILLLSWLTPVLAILIKIDSKGPVFFLQKRNKKNGKIFTCIKFRSMIVNTNSDILPAVENDKRISTIGRFLRKHYLDELPQFLNVLWGDMSVIGPRPYMICDNITYEALVEHYPYRHTIKPGITGLAQVLGPEIANHRHQVQDRLNMDIYYIRHWSLKMDLAILYRSFLKVFAG